METRPRGEFYFGSRVELGEGNCAQLAPGVLPGPEQEGWVVVKPLESPEGTFLEWKVGTYTVSPPSSFLGERNVSLIVLACTGSLRGGGGARGAVAFGQWLPGSRGAHRG